MQISDENVYALLSCLDIYKSHGPDEINSKILKLLSGNLMLIGAVSNLFRSCVKYEKVPEIWKHAIVIPLSKKGSRLDASNYRPVSLTCVLCKVYEKLSRRHILQHVQNKVSSLQHGFVTGKSCLSNLLETVEEIANVLDHGHDVDLIYLDFCKAFDSFSFIA